jgi:hypothetical protein
MNPREHARLARLLIDACNGLDEAAAACRVSKSKLSDYQNPHSALFMPADVMCDLERYCGRAIYSAAIFDRVQPGIVSEDLEAVTCDLTEAGAELQRLTRRALADRRLTPREIDELAKAEDQVVQVLGRVRGAREAAEKVTT